MAAGKSPHPLHRRCHKLFAWIFDTKSYLKTTLAQHLTQVKLFATSERTDGADFWPSDMWYICLESRRDLDGYWEAERKRVGGGEGAGISRLCPSAELLNCWTKGWKHAIFYLMSTSQQLNFKLTLCTAIFWLHRGETGGRARGRGVGHGALGHG